MTDIQIIWNSNNGFYVKFYGECSDEYISRFHKFLIKYEVFKSTDKVTHTVRSDLSMFRGSNYRDISFVKTFFDIMENKPAPIIEPVIEFVPQIIEPNETIVTNKFVSQLPSVRSETITKPDPLLDLKKLIRNKIIKKNEYLGSSDSDSSVSPKKESPKAPLKIASKVAPKTEPKIAPKTAPKLEPKTAPKVAPKPVSKPAQKTATKQPSKTAPSKTLTKNVSKELERKQLSLLEQESSSLDINSSDIPTQSGSGDESDLESDETSSGSYETGSTEENSESDTPIKSKGGRKK